jgi:hypothetical protein
MADKPEEKPARRTRERQEGDRKPVVGEGISAAEASELTTGRASATMDQIAELGQETMPGPLALGETAADSNVSDELTGNGVAFGEMVKSVGLAVAAAQTALDKTLVDTAKALSETEINTVAVFEQKIKDDDGTMEKGEVHIQKLPLTNYLMPTAYQWSRVYLEADANVQEFNSRTGFNVQQKSFSMNASAGGSYSLFGGFRGGASTSMGFGSASTGVDTAMSTDLAAGKLHMEATLEPRSDIELPRPFILQKGPRMQLLVGARETLHEGNDPTKPVTGTKVTLTAALQKTNGDPMEAGKTLSVSLSDPTLLYDLNPSGQTDGNGKMTITVKREGAAFDPTTPIRAMVRVSFGLVSASAGIAL